MGETHLADCHSVISLSLDLLYDQSRCGLEDDNADADAITDQVTLIQKLLLSRHTHQYVERDRSERGEEELTDSPLAALPPSSTSSHRPFHHRPAATTNTSTLPSRGAGRPSIRGW